MQKYRLTRLRKSLYKNTTIKISISNISGGNHEFRKDKPKE